MVEINCKKRPGTQVVRASDQTSCLIVNSKSDRRKFYFSFYANYHPSFLITSSDSQNRFKLTVRTVNCTENFLVIFN